MYSKTLAWTVPSSLLEIQSGSQDISTPAPFMEQFHWAGNASDTAHNELRATMEDIQEGEQTFAQHFLKKNEAFAVAVNIVMIIVRHHSITVIEIGK